MRWAPSASKRDLSRSQPGAPEGLVPLCIRHRVYRCVCQAWTLSSESRIGHVDEIGQSNRPLI
ncbi:MAG: hypothetical protein CL933_17835 [Deltaproteobacteria bacterium]|nr:hypothetical protein [Deltaproteobacteria bacterium]